MERAFEKISLNKKFKHFWFVFLHFIFKIETEEKSYILFGKKRVGKSHKKSLEKFLEMHLQIIYV